MFLITGCGRSGTGYMSKVLSGVGLSVGHERCGRDGAVSWCWAANSNVYPGKHEKGPRPKFDVVLHQVCNPTKTVASMTTANKRSWNFIFKHQPNMAKFDNNKIERCTAYWVYWNLKAEYLAKRNNGFTYQVESVEEVWRHICRAIGIATNTPFKSVPKNVNTRKHIDLDWEKIEEMCCSELFNQARDLSIKYGYD